MKAVDGLVDEKEFKEANKDEKKELESDKKFMIMVNKIRKKEKIRSVGEWLLRKGEKGRSGGVLIIKKMSNYSIISISLWFETMFCGFSSVFSCCPRSVFCL